MNLNPNAKLLLFDLVRCEITGDKLLAQEEADIKELYALSKKHDLVHLVFDAAIRNGLITTDNEHYDKPSKTIMVAISRYQQQNYQLIRIKECFQKNSIAFVPLKGSIIRDHYPQPWMRTSCDIDILVHEEDLNKASKALESIGFITDGTRNYHDVSFFSGNVHLELHFSICENNKQLDIVLKDVWKNIEQYDGYEYRESSDFFMFHHIAHMAYHFLSGGCGIRPVLDLWVLRQKYKFDETKLLELLNKCNLISFYNHICHLSNVWLGEEQHDETTLMMEQYILKGGVFGTMDNSVVSGIAKHKGNKTKYKLSMVFLPYENMCVIYPSLRKRKILLPFYYIHRIFTKTFSKKEKRARKRAKAIDNYSQKEAKELAYLLNELELID